MEKKYVKIRITFVGKIGIRNFKTTKRLKIFSSIAASISNEDF
jgi:hypothetical protein